MLTDLKNTAKLITDGKLLHISGTETLLRKLPKGKWIGGSTEYFMSKDGGKVSGELMFVTEFPYAEFSIRSYDASDISSIAIDAYKHGFSIVIVPFDSAVHREYAENAAGFEKIFMKNIAGWISGLNLGVPDQTPIAVNGMLPAVYTDRAVALHVKVPEEKSVNINMVNIFIQDEKSPIIEFKEEGFSVTKCIVNGKETVLADYIAKNKIDTKLPLVGDYSGSGVNISFKSIENGVVNFYAPVFSGIKYRIAKNILNYEKEFKSRLSKLTDKDTIFSCNCILNFLYGELEGKNIEAFDGPITFGEIAYQLVNQTLVYVTVSDKL
jgi:hypothetical protein